MKTDLLKDGAVSRLYIARAVKTDSGNYTCGMRNAQASVTVHILNGESVAMLKGFFANRMRVWIYIATPFWELFCPGCVLYTMYASQRWIDSWRSLA